MPSKQQSRTKAHAAADYQFAVKKWAAGLFKPPIQVADITEVEFDGFYDDNGTCGFGTCDYSEHGIEVTVRRKGKDSRSVKISGFTLGDIVRAITGS